MWHLSLNVVNNTFEQLICGHSSTPHSDDVTFVFFPLLKVKCTFYPDFIPNHLSFQIFPTPTFSLCPPSSSHSSHIFSTCSTSTPFGVVDENDQPNKLTHLGFLSLTVHGWVIFTIILQVFVFVSTWLRSYREHGIFYMAQLCPLCLSFPQIQSNVFLS